jgi:hypothetical protein
MRLPARVDSKMLRLILAMEKFPAAPFTPAGQGSSRMSQRSGPVFAVCNSARKFMIALHLAPGFGPAPILDGLQNSHQAAKQTAALRLQWLQWQTLRFMSNSARICGPSRRSVGGAFVQQEHAALRHWVRGEAFA